MFADNSAFSDDLFHEFFTDYPLFLYTEKLVGFETGYCYDLRLTFFMPRFPACWDHRCALAYIALQNIYYQFHSLHRTELTFSGRSTNFKKKIGEEKGKK